MIVVDGVTAVDSMMLESDVKAIEAAMVEDAATPVEISSMDDGLTTAADCCSVGADVVLVAMTMDVDDVVTPDIEIASEDNCVPSDVITPSVVPFATDTLDSTNVSLADVSMESVVACALITAIIVDVIASGAPVLTSRMCHPPSSEQHWMMFLRLLRRSFPMSSHLASCRGFYRCITHGCQSSI